MILPILTVAYCATMLVRPTQPTTPTDRGEHLTPVRRVSSVAGYKISNYTVFSYEGQDMPYSSIPKDAVVRHIYACESGWVRKIDFTKP